jgi:hypothetical protein
MNNSTSTICITTICSTLECCNHLSPTDGLRAGAGRKDAGCTSSHQYDPNARERTPGFKTSSRQTKITDSRLTRKISLALSLNTPRGVAEGNSCRRSQIRKVSTTQSNVSGEFTLRSSTFVITRQKQQNEGGFLHPMLRQYKPNNDRVK